MNIRNTFLGKSAFLLLAACAFGATAETTTYISRPGSKMRIEGTSTIHDWRCESPFIRGMMEVSPGFPTEPGATATPGKVDVKVNVSVVVKSLKSLKEDGKPYSDRMDEVMYEHLKSDKNPFIAFHLTELTLKEAAKAKDAPYLFDAKGELAVSGVTNSITMPVNVLPLGDKKIKISGTTKVKMTDYKVDPPAPSILGMSPIKTGDEVKIIFEWLVAEKPAAK